MKRIIVVLITLLIITGCNSKTNSSEVSEDAYEVRTGKYDIYNALDAKVTELYLYESGSETKGKNHVQEEALNENGHIQLTYEASIDTLLTLEYVDENGRTYKFETLSIEEDPISLLALDATTGPTAIAFDVVEGDGSYEVYNLTGETVSELYLYKKGSSKGENLAGKGLANNKMINLEYHGTLDTVLVIEFVTKSGLNSSFDRLAIETAPISLLALDARSGPSAVSFSKPE